MKVALITGITGQDGSYLAELLLEKDYIVHGVIRRSSSFNTGRIDTCLDRLHLHYGDITDTNNVMTILTKLHRQYVHLVEFERLEIYNLAAMSHVRVSFDIPEYTMDADATGVMRICETVHKLGMRSYTRIYQASSSEMYGKVLETPQNENTPFNPCSPYAIAKVAGFYTVKMYREGYGLFACNGILFNHEGVRRGKTFVTRKITCGLKKILEDPSFILQLGNLDAKRDWGWAPDYVYGMWLMMQQKTPGDYVLATGKQYTVREFVEKAFQLRGIEVEWSGQGTDERGVDRNTGRIVIEIDPRLFRPAEVDTLLGDASKAKKELGWEPHVSFDRLVEFMVDRDVQK